MTPWRLAIRQIRRNPVRSGLMLAAVGLAALCLAGVVVLIRGTDRSIGRTVGQMGADLMVVDEPFIDEYRPEWKPIAQKEVRQALGLELLSTVKRPYLIEGKVVQRSVFIFKVAEEPPGAP